MADAGVDMGRGRGRGRGRERGLFSDMVGSERGCKDCQGYKTRGEEPVARHLHRPQSFDTSISVPPAANFPMMRYLWYRTCFSFSFIVEPWARLLFCCMIIRKHAQFICGSSVS